MERCSSRDFAPFSTISSSAVSNGTTSIFTFSGPGTGGPANLTNVSGTLFFTAANQGYGRELWVSDGTHDGTRMVKDIYQGPGSSNPDHLTNVNGSLFFSADDGVHGRELWASDGTDTGTYLVADINSGPASSNLDYLTNVNGALYFTADDGIHGRQLWASDGTGPGTLDQRRHRPGNLHARGYQSRPRWLRPGPFDRFQWGLVLHRR
jgi:ELWxxDGT repeat protein